MVAASTNPAAATVLPEAVGCLNRYRRTAPGSWSGSASASASLSSPFCVVARRRCRRRRPRRPRRPRRSSLGLLVVLELEVERQRQRRAGRGGLAGVVGQRRRRIVVVAVAVAVAVARPRRRRSRPPSCAARRRAGRRACRPGRRPGARAARGRRPGGGLSSDRIRCRPSTSANRRRHVGRRRRQTGVDLEQRLVVGGAERGAGRKRHRGVVAHRDEAIASPPLDSLELGRLNARILRCLGGDLFGQPRTSV